MRYWIYSNNEVQGPFEIRELAAKPGFTGSSLVCPEAADGGQAAEWKEASNYPEIFATPSAPASPPAAAPRPAPAGDMLELTMRGSLVSAPVFDEQEKPAPPPAQGASKVGDLVFSPPPAKPAAVPAQDLPPSAPPTPSQAPAGPSDPRMETLKKKLDQMSSTLSAMGESQVQLTGRIGMLESAIADMKAMLESGGAKSG